MDIFLKISHNFRIKYPEVFVKISMLIYNKLTVYSAILQWSYGRLTSASGPEATFY